MTPVTLTFAPVRREDRLVLERRGDLLIANGEVFDLAAGAEEASGEGWVQSVRQTETGLEVMVILPHGADAPEEVRFPQPVTVETDGEIAVPG